jgi:hypothetical protein
LSGVVLAVGIDLERVGKPVIMAAPLPPFTGRRATTTCSAGSSKAAMMSRPAGSLPSSTMRIGKPILRSPATTPARRS